MCKFLILRTWINKDDLFKGEKCRLVSLLLFYIQPNVLLSVGFDGHRDWLKINKNNRLWWLIGQSTLKINMIGYPRGNAFAILGIFVKQYKNTYVWLMCFILRRFAINFHDTSIIYFPCLFRWISLLSFKQTISFFYYHPNLDKYSPISHDGLNLNR